MVKYKNIIFITALVMALFSGLQSYCQTVLTIDQAFNIAKANNHSLRSEALTIQYQQSLVNSALKMDATQLGIEAGQFNSAYFDTGIGIMQNFNHPKWYKVRKDANVQLVRTAETSLVLSEVEIKRQLQLIYLEYAYFKQKEMLWMHQDSLYSAFLAKATMRWEKGEAGILEKTTAENQKWNVSNQLAMLKKMEESILKHLAFVLNDKGSYIPAVQSWNLWKNGILFDSMAVLNHPILQLAEQEVTASKLMTNIEKSALLPGFNAGYRNISIRGVGADNLSYSGGDRFSSFQAGISIPIFRKGIQSSIQAAQMMENIKSADYDAKKAELFNKIHQAFILYRETAAQVEKYEQQGLVNAGLIRSVAEKQFSTGEINYLEYVTLLHQAITIEHEYVELIKKANEYIIEIQYLTKI